MQISAATLLASQQVSQVQANKPAPAFAQALDKASGFQPLPLKQTASVEDAAPNFPHPTRAQKPGSTIDIKV